MRRLALAALAVLLASPSLAQVCSNSVTLRQETCPAGTTCTTKGSTLTFAELDDNLAGIAELCEAFSAWPALFTFSDGDGGEPSVGVSSVVMYEATRSLTPSHRQLQGGGVGLTLDADIELYRDTKCITTSSPTASDDWLFFRAESALTVTGIDCMVVGGTSVATLVKECDGNGANCSNIEASITCGTTNTTEASSIDNASVDAGDWIRVDPGTVTGAVTQLSVCVTFTWND